MNQLVKKGFDNYLELIKLVTELYNIVQSNLKSKDKTISIQKELENVDVAIQYGLIEIAINDFSLSKEEIEYIKSLCKYKDFTSYLKDTKFNGTSWEVLYLAEKDELEELIKQLKEDIFKLITPFITTLSTLDVQLQERKYLSNFKTYLENIVIGLVSNTKDYNYNQIIGNSFFNEMIQKIIEAEIKYNKPIKRIQRFFTKIFKIKLKK